MTDADTAGSFAASARRVFSTRRVKQFDGGIWNVYFGPLKLGRLNERYMRIEDEYGRLKRKNL